MPLALQNPRRLGPGDRIAVVSLSWGGPGTVPQRYAAGKRQLEETLGLTVVDMPHTMASADNLAARPEWRAADLHQAFADPSIAGVFASIGGDDSIRLLPHLDLDIIRKNPKVFLGFSDTTVIHLACLSAGLASFYGPSIMAGFAENGGMHAYTIESLRKTLFLPEPPGLIPTNTDGWTTERTDWSDPIAQSKPRVLNLASPPKILQGTGIARGPLIGGCAEVLEMAKGTAWWPSLDAWDGAILFYETSEDAPPAKFIRYWLRNYAAQGILSRLNGILLARPDTLGDPTYQQQLETAVTDILAEAGLQNLPVLSGLDFGHTMPMLTLPYGATAEIDCSSASLSITTAGVT